MEFILVLLVSFPVPKKVQSTLQLKRDVHNISNYTKPTEKMDCRDMASEISNCHATTLLISCLLEPLSTSPKRLSVAKFVTW
jgi:hypothetical protein